jgi:hypothetical protein
MVAEFERVAANVVAAQFNRCRGPWGLADIGRLGRFRQMKGIDR